MLLPATPATVLLPRPRLPLIARPPALSSDPLAAGWSMLSSNALSIWNTATVATSSFVQTLTEPEEEEFKFPRPEGGAASAAPPPVSAPSRTSPALPPQPPRPARSTSATHAAPPPAPTSSLLDLDMTGPHRSHSSPTLSAVAPASPYASTVRTAPSSGSGTKGSGAKKLELQSDDDFFSSFGIN
jgi:hypothetical protein